MDPFHAYLALGPLAAYLLLVGILNLSRRPFLTTGTRDLYALGLAISGLMIVGPLNLFMPDRAAQMLGPHVWLMLVALYALCLTLIVLLVRPRLVIYNISYDQLRPLLANMISRLNLEHQWAGESLALPEFGVQLEIVKFSALRNISLLATAAEQDHSGWWRLEAELARELRGVAVKPNPLGVLLVAVGIAIFVGSIAWMLQDPQAVADSAMDWLRL